jgi:hypothetical protein
MSGVRATEPSCGCCGAPLLARPATPDKGPLPQTRKRICRIFRRAKLSSQGTGCLKPRTVLGHLGPGGANGETEPTLRTTPCDALRRVANATRGIWKVQGASIADVPAFQGCCAVGPQCISDRVPLAVSGRNRTVAATFPTAQLVQGALPEKRLSHRRECASAIPEAIPLRSARPVGTPGRPTGPASRTGHRARKVGGI